MQWIKSIDIAETPAWSGLPNNVEKLLRERQSAALIAEIKKIQGIGDDLDGDEDDENEKDNDGQSAWLKELQQRLEILEQNLPGQLDLLHRTDEKIKNPLFRFLEREVTVASELLDVVRKDILQLIELCQAKRKSTR